MISLVWQGWLLQSLFVLLLAINVQCCCYLWLPPATRLILQQDDSLQRDCQAFVEQRHVGLHMAWEPLAREGYRFAHDIFEKISQGPPPVESSSSSSSSVSTSATPESRGFMLCFPRCPDQTTQRLKNLMSVINDNSELLGNIQATVYIWPNSPCTMVKLLWKSTKYHRQPQQPLEVSAVDVETAMANTRDWVENTLCRLRLCPYTASMERAAVGLEVASVYEGPIQVRHTLSDAVDNNHPETVITTVPALAAVMLAASFWKGVLELATRPQEEVATLLIIAPPCYDQDVHAFYDICDHLLEPSLQTVHAQEYVGRAWFHPHYDASSVGHSTILPGHALPATMVQSFVETYYNADQPTKKTTVPPLDTMDIASIAKANNMVRWTPHATINLLRRTQLTAAKQVEATLPNPRPNYIYARNVVRILHDNTSTSMTSR